MCLPAPDSIFGFTRQNSTYFFFALWKSNHIYHLYVCCSLLRYSVPWPRRSCIQQFPSIRIMRIRYHLHIESNALCIHKDWSSIRTYDNWHHRVSISLSLIHLLDFYMWKLINSTTHTFSTFFSFFPTFLSYTCLRCMQLCHCRVQTKCWKCKRCQKLFNTVQTSRWWYTNLASLYFLGPFLIYIQLYI